MVAAAWPPMSRAEAAEEAAAGAAAAPGHFSACNSVCSSFNAASATGPHGAEDASASDGKWSLAAGACRRSPLGVAKAAEYGAVVVAGVAAERVPPGVARASDEASPSSLEAGTCRWLVVGVVGVRIRDRLKHDMQLCG